MSTPPAGTTKKRIFSRDDYLAPLPVPTGEKPEDVLKDAPINLLRGGRKS